MISDDDALQKLEAIRELMTAGSNESDRGLTIIIASYIDDSLRKLIESFLISHKDVSYLFDDPYAPFSSLSGKIKAAYLMGLITKSEMDRIDAVRKVRNIFAHRINADFTNEELKKLCSKKPIYDGRLCDRDAFFHMAVNVSLPIGLTP